MIACRPEAPSRGAESSPLKEEFLHQVVFSKNRRIHDALWSSLALQFKWDSYKSHSVHSSFPRQKPLKRNLDTANLKTWECLSWSKDSMCEAYGIVQCLAHPAWKLSTSRKVSSITSGFGTADSVQWPICLAEVGSCWHWESWVHTPGDHGLVQHMFDTKIGEILIILFAADPTKALIHSVSRELVELAEWATCKALWSFKWKPQEWLHVESCNWQLSFVACFMIPITIPGGFESCGLQSSTVPRGYDILYW